MRTMKIHTVPGVDARAAACDLLETGAIGIDDISGGIYDVIRDEIIEELGFAGDGLDLRTQRVATSSGPVFVVRETSVWSAADARRTILHMRGRP